jgi:gas vesicle protein
MANTTVPNLEPNPLQKALETYHELERQHREATEDLVQARAEGAQLLSEVNMLRDHVKQIEAERVRWQAIAATLLGRLQSINDIIAGAVKDSIRNGFEAKQPEDREELEQAAKEAAAIIQRAAENGRAEGASEANPLPEPPQARETAIPKVDFGTGGSAPAAGAAYRR